MKFRKSGPRVTFIKQLLLRTTLKNKTRKEKKNCDALHLEGRPTSR